MKKYLKIALSMAISVSLFTGCTTSTINMNEDNTQNNKEIIERKVNDSNEEIDQNNDKEDTQQEDKAEEINLQEIKPNEAGQIMVIMYHGLGDEEKVYVRSRGNFREDLRLLYEKGYRLVSLKDYINNEINVEAGKTPVVLTFDDGNLTDFNIIEENGERKIDPDSAVGILEDFNKKHPDFGLEATFHIFGENPFRQKDLIDYKLKYIVDNGMDIGNHTFGHDKLSELSEKDIQKTLSKNVEFIKQYLPDYEVNILALPNGLRPKSEEKRKYLISDSFEGNRYNNIGILAVGWRPEYPSSHKKFDFEYINRVHGSSEEFGIRYWLEYFDNHPEKKYISDGDKDIITVPESQKDVIDESKLEGKSLRTYNLEKESE